MQIVIVTNEDERREFIREVGEEVLPELYGGKAKLVAIQDVELPPLQNGSINWLRWFASHAVMSSIIGEKKKRNDFLQIKITLYIN